ncbi:hypothetical protein M885DRAFT_506016 [Pelagophyceae sp. CCMP2097]|nr:hypothetical protein M885DRAFT_506016 [Pelagophyceae sp. CCMP2097]|mmetsp:Transcript_33446/g.115070  ORF Transcript_33446/g.115070 Transcript_33446/m.115070 type:complete len:235 (-) Transcript_33446:46-750(-)
MALQAFRRVQWLQDGARILAEAVDGSRPLLIHGMLAPAACEALLARVSQTGRDAAALALRPAAGTNLVSSQSTPRRQRAFACAELLGGARAGQVRLDVPPVFDATQLGLPFALADEDCAFFVTSAGLRTPLHSDERHGLLLHLSGAKNFVIFEPADSDADHETLRTLLDLRKAPGDHETLYGAGRTNAALETVPFHSGTLEPGDALLLPQRWLHDLESVTATVSLSLRWGKRKD